MSNRVTREILETQAYQVFSMTGHDMSISEGHGGFAVVSVNEGRRNIITPGYIPARECQLFMAGMIWGARLTK